MVKTLTRYRDGNIYLFLEENNTGPSPARVETGHLPPAVVLAVVGLHHAEIAGSVVAAHSEEFLSEDADPDGVPAYGETPGVSGIPLPGGG